MKKAYVKPVMESEEFVVNEYVAACYEITCVGHLGGEQKCGSTIVTKEPNNEWNGDGFIGQSGADYLVYVGTINNTYGIHFVTSKKKSDGNGPNAS